MCDNDVLLNGEFMNYSELDYRKSIDYLHSLEKFGIKLGLERIKKLLAALGNPEKDFKTIHVAGTNGKGSVCAMIASVLKESNYKTGLYTSPHLIDFRERIVINGKKIPKQKISVLIKDMRRVADKMRPHPTYFEFITALAFKYFSEQKVDLAVVEVGMGGRFDATNVIYPEVSIITNVSFEHTEHLGKTIKKIAKEKAGIIKCGRPVITSAKGVALKVIENKCKELKSNLIILDEKSFDEKDMNIDNQKFVLYGVKEDYNLTSRLVGKHQMLNACCAVACAELLGIRKGYVIKGIKNVFWPGRFEVVQKNPVIILDGAHNPDGIKALKNTLVKIFGNKKIFFVISICSDKDIEKMIREIAPLVKEIVITKHAVMNRAANPLVIKKLAEKHVSKYANNIVVKKTVKTALNYVRKKARKDDIICVTGSIFTVAGAKEVL